MNRRIWFQRQFELGLPKEAFPDILERIRGTPARLEERLSELLSSDATARPEGAWSIQGNVGHLPDLEPLWSGRLDDLLGVSAVLREADQPMTAVDLFFFVAEHDDHHLATISAIARAS